MQNSLWKFASDLESRHSLELVKKQSDDDTSHVTVGVGVRRDVEFSVHFVVVEERTLRSEYGEKF